MIVNVSFDKLKNIIHIADVHIRLFHRHGEYRETFDSLYQDIQAKIDNNDLEDFIIVLAGDILHAKNDMSPEMVQMTSEFLSRLADFAPTIMIAGNHDLNLSNLNRLDSLSPIVNNLQHDNLFYIKHSNIVRVADTDIAVFSVLDNESEWPEIKNCKADNKIAVFHGPVDGADAEGFKIYNNKYSVEMFDGFDIVLLGDIHTHQVLQQRNEKLKKPVVVYPSSLIQQNHGETLENHGWCLWNIPERKFDFVELKNEYGYCTLEIESGKINFPRAMPSKPRIRLFTGDAPQSTVNKIITLLRSKYDVMELSLNKRKFDYSPASKLIPKKDLLDLNNASIQFQYIKEWLNRNHVTITPELFDIIEKINSDTNLKIVHDDKSRNINWRPLKFKFSNMFSYGSNNEITFSDMNGLYGVFAPNASGKSSLIDALMFCLYDKTPRAFRGHDIMNNRKNRFFCELSFEINNETYSIRRVGNRKKNGSVKVDVLFWKELSDGTRESLNGEDRRSTNLNIRNYVGTYEDFIMTAMSGQLANALFIDKSHSERKDLLIQFMGLNIFDKLYVEANDGAKEISAVLKRFDKDQVTDKIKDFSDDAADIANKVSALNIELNALEEEKDEIDEAIQAATALKKPAPSEDIDLSKVENSLQLEEEDLLRNKELLSEYKKSLKNFNSQLEACQKKREVYNVKELGEGKDKYEELLKAKEAKINVQELIKHSHPGYLERKNSLTQYKYNPDCEICTENYKQVIDELTDLEKIIERNVTDIDDIDQELEEFDKELNDLKVIVDSYDDWKELNTTKFSLENKINRLNLDKQKTDLDIERNKDKIRKFKNKIKLYNKNKNNIEHNKIVDVAIEEQKQLLSANKKNYSVKQKEFRELHSRHSVILNKKADLIERLKEAEQLDVEYQAYSYYLEAIGRNGVPYDIIKETIPIIEKEINNILSQVVDFGISLDVDGKNINGRVVYDYDQIWPLENSSGMERFISSLAIRVALMNVSNLPKPNFLFIDEGFGVLDREHLHSMQTLFNLLKSNFDFILIVSHLETARDMVDNLIEIHKEDGYSKISI